MLIDSNVIIYALNSASPKNQESRLFIKAQAKRAVIAHQNILEVTRVMTHPKFANKFSVTTITKGIEQVTRAMKIIYPQEETLFVYQNLIKKYQPEGNRVFDLYLAATALSNGVREIATDNVRHFKDFEEIRVINPYQ